MDQYECQTEEKTSRYRRLFKELAAVGGEPFLCAAKEYLSHERVIGGMGDRVSPAISKFLPNPKNITAANLTFADSMRDFARGLEKTAENEQEVDEYKTVVKTWYPRLQGKDECVDYLGNTNQTAVISNKRRTFWKPHYLASTKVTEMRRNANKRLNAPEPIIPFVVGSANNQSHNILLICQHILAQLHRTQGSREVSREFTDKTVKHNPQPVSSEMSALIAQSQTNDSTLQNFKQVLNNLYEEFVNFSRAYDQVVEGRLKKDIKKRYAKDELDQLETLMHKKEEEIMLLIVLYREVLDWKDKAQRRAPKYQLENHQNLTRSASTNFRLKFLLHQVQKFEKLLIKVKK